MNDIKKQFEALVAERKALLTVAKTGDIQAKSAAQVAFRKIELLQDFNSIRQRPAEMYEQHTPPAKQGILEPVRNQYQGTGIHVDAETGVEHCFKRIHGWDNNPTGQWSGEDEVSAAATEVMCQTGSEPKGYDDVKSVAWSSLQHGAMCKLYDAARKAGICLQDVSEQYIARFVRDFIDRHQQADEAEEATQLSRFL